jgi:hypothetical protein
MPVMTWRRLLFWSGAGFVLVWVLANVALAIASRTTLPENAIWFVVSIAYLGCVLGFIAALVWDAYRWSKA